MIRDRLRSLVIRRARRRPVRVDLDRAIVSFTFDDIPASAATDGARLLEAEGFRGTFYVSAGLLGTSCPNWDHVTPDALGKLSRGGHEIGCHTHAHRRVDEMSADELTDDSARNARELARVVGGGALEHFAYPFGRVSLTAKKVLGDRFLTMRGISPGINVGTVDRNLLRAVPLYTGRATEESVRSLVRRAIEERGWLIFYTHDVTAAPSRFGTTPELFRAAVEACRHPDVRVLPVAEAFARLVQTRSPALS